MTMKDPTVFEPLVVPLMRDPEDFDDDDDEYDEEDDEYE
jgi:hypothetical protein